MKYALLVLLLSTTSFAGIMDDFDELGGNKILVDKAQDLAPNKHIKSVQKRIVDRNSLSEMNLQMGTTAGGESYLSTQNYGVAYNYHFNPRWSVGAQYYTSYNQLSPEGEQIVDEAESKPGTALVPDIDYPKNTYMALVNWYPIYGKMNLHDLGIAHFDVYALGGYGQVQMRSGTKGTYTLGGGMAFWLSQHLSSRMEVRHQSYQATRFNGEQSMNLTVASFMMGYLL